MLMPRNDTTPHASGETPVDARQLPFQLFGSMRLNVPEAEFDSWLDANRRAQAEALVRKLKAL